MEMQEITEKERSKGDEGANEPMLEVKTEDTRNLIKPEEAEPDHYSKLQNPSENIYSEAVYEGAPVKITAAKKTEGNGHLYRAGCLFLTLICLVLLLVVIILSMKLQAGSRVCPEKQEATAPTIAADSRSHSFSPPCSYEQCQTHYSDIQPKRLGCQQCADGWLTFDKSCFYLSTFRLSWDESQRNCTARGGSLAVITSRRVQNFLTKEGKLKYWIGLRHKGDMWTWVTHTVLRQSYWAEDESLGDCGILSSGNPPEKNWVKARCHTYTYFICQL